MDAHRRLFSILLGIQHLAQESINKHDLITDLPKIYVSNFNFICGPVGNKNMYRCKPLKTSSLVQTIIPKKKEFVTAMESGRIPKIPKRNITFSNISEDLISFGVTEVIDLPHFFLICTGISENKIKVQTIIPITQASSC